MKRCAGNFLEFMIGGLTYPDDSIKSSVVYVLVQLCKKGQANSLSLPLVQNMCQNVSTNLATAKSQELTINLLGETIIWNCMAEPLYLFLCIH